MTDINKKMVAWDDKPKIDPKMVTWKDSKEPFKMDPTEGMSGLDRFWAATGKGATDLARGIGQNFGLVSQEEIAEAKKRDAPLLAPMKGPGGLTANPGRAGNITGGVAPFLPLSFVPGANTIAGSALLGGAMGASQPVEQGSVVGGKLTNALTGAALGGATQGFLGATGKAVANRPGILAKQEAQNSARDATLQIGKGEGYVVPPTQSNPSLINKALEGFSGKLSTAQSASVKNQQVTNKLAREELGLQKDAPISSASLDNLRKDAGEAYEAVKASVKTIKPDAKFRADLQALRGDFSNAAKDYPDLIKNDAIEDLIKALDTNASPRSMVELTKKLRKDGASNLKAFDDPGKQALGRAQRDAAAAVEEMIDRALSSVGKNDLVKQWRDARQLIAKSYDVESALNDATGDVSAIVLGKLLKKGKPLTGKLETAAQFGQSFPKAVQDIKSSMPGISPLDYGTAGLLTGISGDPMMLALTLARPSARATILSKPYQGIMANPNYRPGMLTQGAGKLASSEYNQALLRNLVPALAVQQ